MKRAALDHVEQGEILGRPILSSDGRVLLAQGAQLTVGLLSKLRHMGVTTIYLQDDLLDDIELEELVSEETRRETIQELSHSFQYIQEKNKNFDTKKISASANKMIDEIMKNDDVLLSVSDIRTKDNQLFVHSVHVCMLSILIAGKFGLDQSKIQQLAIGALLHDVGKIMEDDLNVGANETDGDPNHHTWKGFNYLRKKPDISALSAHIALQHHEHVNGTGEPREISGSDIHLFAKITAVANAFDNLIASVNEQQPIHPYEACERIMALTNIQFDHDVVWHFLRSIAFYPTGSQVLLTTGETGVVVGQNHGLPQRPIVRVFTGSNDAAMEDYAVKEIDMSVDVTVFIKEILA